MNHTLRIYACNPGFKRWGFRRFNWLSPDDDYSALRAGWEFGLGFFYLECKL